MKAAIALFLLLLIIGGGVGAYYAFDVKLPFLDDASPGGKKEVKPIDSRFTPVDKIVVPVIRGARIHRHVEIILVIESDGRANQENVQAKAPQLRDAFTRELTEFINLQFDESNHPNVDQIKKRLKIIADRTIGPGAVHEVLVEQLFARKP